MRSHFVRIPRSVWALGVVSLFMDVSSEMIHALLPVFLVTALGASTLTVGIIEGFAEATANVTKVFSGAASDWFRRRKALTVIGYGLSAATKPMFALAQSVGLVFGARFIDRVGKGIRGAPRDALIADAAPADLRGASFGLRQALDTLGAAIGPLAAIGFMILTANSFRTVFWIASIPAVLAVIVLVVAVREPVHRHAQSRGSRPRVADLRRLGGAFWSVVTVASILTMARFSEAFLILRAQDVGLRAAFVPVVLVVMNLAYAVSAYPAGVLGDAFGRRRVVTAGFAFLIAADGLLAIGSSISLTLVGVALWGLHMGFTQGVFAALVAETAPIDLRGSAFGVFNLALGLTLLAASVLAGALWSAYGPPATFLVGAAFTAVALAGVLHHPQWRREFPIDARE